MSQDESEDVKPKLSLVVNYDGQRGSSSTSVVLVLTARTTDITVKVKPNMPFRKIFEAAEVVMSSSHTGYTDHVAETFSKRTRQVSATGSTRCTHDYRAGTFRFVYQGDRLKPDGTPAEVRFLTFHVRTLTP